jgi:hypothetical protein
MGASGKGVTATPALCFLIKFRWKQDVVDWVVTLAHKQMFAWISFEPPKRAGPIVVYRIFFSFSFSLESVRLNTMFG